MLEFANDAYDRVPQMIGVGPDAAILHSAIIAE